MFSNNFIITTKFMINLSFVSVFFSHRAITLFIFFTQLFHILGIITEVVHIDLT